MSEDFADHEVEPLDQLDPADSLIVRGADPLDEGIVPPDNWSPAQGFGSTPAEMAQGETLEQRLRQEETDPDPYAPVPDPTPDTVAREVGSLRAGRLVAPATVAGSDVVAQSVAEDVGISGGAASAEEAAMHIITDEEQAAAEHTDD